jgi:hypothetical protein
MRAAFFGCAFLLAAGGSLCAADDDNAAVHYRKAFELLPKLSTAETALLDDLPNASLDDKSKDLLKRSEPALEELNRGASLSRCDWGLDLSEKGFNEMTKLFSRERRMGQLGCLKCRCLFEQKQPAAALDQFADVRTLARHVGTGGPYISWLVEVAVESMAIHAVAAYLPQQNAETLTALSARLDALPKATPLSVAVLGEREFVLRSLRPQYAGKKTPEEIRAALKNPFTADPKEDVEAIMQAAGNSVAGGVEVDR